MQPFPGRLAGPSGTSSILHMWCALSEGLWTPLHHRNAASRYMELLWELNRRPFHLGGMWFGDIFFIWGLFAREIINIGWWEIWMKEYYRGVFTNEFLSLLFVLIVLIPVISTHFFSFSSIICSYFPINFRSITERKARRKGMYEIQRTGLIIGMLDWCFFFFLWRGACGMFG